MKSIVFYVKSIFVKYLSLSNYFLISRILKEPKDVCEHLKAFLKYICAQRLVDLSLLNVKAGASVLYTMSLYNANRLRESLRLYNKVVSVVALIVYFYKV